MSKWTFPSNTDGQVKGVADAGIENFNGTEIASLARENCQNSLDAAVDDDNPRVRVEFERYLIHDYQIPGIQDYRKIMRDCKAFWDLSQSEKAKEFLKKAVRRVDEESSFVLRISDYNTTGLDDPYGLQNTSVFNFEGWNSLIKIDGGANKGDDKAGAFGIGKSAPFCNSNYRLVFYRTLNRANERATQGVSRILSYPVDTDNFKNKFTTGVGYYGNPDGNSPEPYIEEIEQLNKRESQGTDVFIYGFSGKNADPAWNDEIEKAIFDSFLMSIYYGHLVVKVQDDEINSDNIGSYIRSLHAKEPAACKSTYGNYLALTRTEGTHKYEYNFHGMGTLRLRILVDPNEKLDKKILVVRKAGMKLFRLGNLAKVVSFTGVLELVGKPLNSFFRKMETVAHDNWEPGRHDDPKLAKAYYDEIKEWIRNVIAELAENSSSDEMDVKGLGGVLQENNPVSTGDNAETESLNDHLGIIEIVSRPIVTNSRGIYWGHGQFGEKDTEPVPGELTQEGASAVRKLHGRRKRGSLKEHHGKPNDAGRDIVHRKKQGGKDNRNLKNVRIIKKNAVCYSVCFTLPTPIESGRVELVTVGENGKSNKLRVKSARAISGCSCTGVSHDAILVSDMKSDDKIRLEVEMITEHNYAMEVNVYANN